MKFWKKNTNPKDKSYMFPKILEGEITRRAGSLGGRDTWVEGFDNSVDKTGNELYTQNRLGRIISEKIWFFFLIVIYGVVSIVLLRAAYLQLHDGKSYRTLAEGNRIRSIPLLPKRGLIYDSQSEIVASNVPLFLLSLKGSDLPKDSVEKKLVLQNLRDLGIILDEVLIDEELKKKSEVILEELSFDKALVMMTVIQDLAGVEVEVYERRKYIDPLEFSHIIGYLGPVNDDELSSLDDNYLLNDFLGKTGVEFVYEKELRGILGAKKIEVDSKGKEEKITDTVYAEDGLNLHLTIDKRVQEKIYSLLSEALSKNDIKRASVVITDPSSGKIISLVSYPGYDNQEFYQGLNSEEYIEVLENPDKPLFNRAVSGQYPPGSTFKTVLGTAGLEEGIITSNTTFISTGGIRVAQWFFPDWKIGGHGATNIYKAISESVNTFFYILGGGYQGISGLGVETIQKYALAYGLLKKTGIDLTNEAEGFFPTPQWKQEVKNERWYIGDTYNLSIGQGDVLVTPIQMTMLTAAIANGGYLYQPHLVDHFSTRDNVPIYLEKNWLKNETIATSDSITTIRRAMRETVVGASGSARSLQVVPVAVAGKTGTAQWHSTKEPHGWFIGFAPYENPEIAFTFLVEESGGGSEIVVPIARTFLTWYFTEYKSSL